MIHDLEFLDSIPSTMDVARENVLAGRIRFDSQGWPDPAGVVAREQTDGRGQRGRPWFAQPGACLSATYYFQHGMLTPATAWPLAFLAGAAVATILQRTCHAAFGIQENSQVISPGASEAETNRPLGPRVGLKWPNDVLLNGRKAGGILIEMVQPAPDKWVALIGIGINLNVRDFPPELEQTATSLVREGLPEADWQQWGLQAARDLESYAAAYHDRGNKGIEALLARWRQFDETQDRWYETMHNGATVRGRAIGIEADGALRLQLEDGTTLCVQSASSIKEVI